MQHLEEIPRHKNLSSSFDIEGSKGRARENELKGSKSRRQTARGPNFVLLKSQDSELPPIFGLLIDREDPVLQTVYE